MKIHRKSSKSQLSLLPNSGSLSSLHETALTSDAEEVRSSVSAYHPVSSYTKRSSKRYFDTLNLTLKCCLWIVNECNIIYQKFEVGAPFCEGIFFGLLSAISKPHSFFAEQEKTLKILSHRFCWPSFDICYCFLSVLDVLLPFQSFRCAFLCSRRGKPHNFAKIHFFQIENKHYNLSNNTKKKERRHNCKNTKRNNMTFCVNSVRPFLKFKRYSDFYQTWFDYSSISLQYTFFLFHKLLLDTEFGYKSRED